MRTIQQVLLNSDILCVCVCMNMFMKSKELQVSEKDWSIKPAELREQKLQHTNKRIYMKKKQVIYYICHTWLFIKRHYNKSLHINK